MSRYISFYFDFFETCTVQNGSIFMQTWNSINNKKFILVRGNAKCFLGAIEAYLLQDHNEIPDIKSMGKLMTSDIENKKEFYKLFIQAMLKN